MSEINYSARIHALQCVTANAAEWSALAHELNASRCEALDRIAELETALDAAQSTRRSQVNSQDGYMVHHNGHYISRPADSEHETCWGASIREAFVFGCPSRARKAARDASCPDAQILTCQ